MLNIEYIKARTFYITTGVLAVLLLGVAGVAAYLGAQNSKLTEQVTAQSGKESELTAKVRELNGKLSKAAATEARLTACESDRSEMEEKVRAFAKQAASCEAIKQKYHFKG